MTNLADCFRSVTRLAVARDMIVAKMSRQVWSEINCALGALQMGFPKKQRRRGNVNKSTSSFVYDGIGTVRWEERRRRFSQVLFIASLKKRFFIT